MDNTDTLRTEFADAYKAYIAEGQRMRELLLQRRLDVDSDARAIVEQQKRLNRAKERYEAANRLYVFHVLGDYSGAPNKAV